MLFVWIDPYRAVSAGAQWRRVGTTTWHDVWDIECGVPAGLQTIEFKPIYGWIQAPNQDVTVSNGVITEVDATYTAITSSLRVTIEPPEAITAGAKWQGDWSSTWFNSGDVDPNSPVGDDYIYFSYVSGWDEPYSLKATVVEGEITSITATYVRQDRFAEGDDYAKRGRNRRSPVAARRHNALV